MRFASGAVGTFESSRVAVGPRCEYGLAVYGTNGSATWDFERMNELDVCLRGQGPYGYTRVLTDPPMGEFGRFQVGAGLGLSFDDLKAVEASLFLASGAYADRPHDLRRLTATALTSPPLRARLDARRRCAARQCVVGPREAGAGGGKWMGSRWWSKVREPWARCRVLSVITLMASVPT